MRKIFLLFFIFLISFKALASTFSLQDNLLNSRDIESLNLNNDEKFSLLNLEKEIKDLQVKINYWNKSKMRERTGSIVATSILFLASGLSILGDWHWCSEESFSEAGCTASLVSSVVSLSSLIGSSVWIFYTFSQNKDDCQKFILELEIRKKLIVDAYLLKRGHSYCYTPTLKKYYDLLVVNENSAKPTIFEVADKICLANRLWMFMDTTVLENSLEVVYNGLGIFNLSGVAVDEIFNKIISEDKLPSNDQILRFESLNKDAIFNNPV